MLRLQDIRKPKDLMHMNNNRVEVAKKTQEVHQQNIQKSLEHRLQVARLRGDEKLIHQLEAEIEQYK